MLSTWVNLMRILPEPNMREYCGCSVTLGGIRSRDRQSGWGSMSTRGRVMRGPRRGCSLGGGRVRSGPVPVPGVSL
jgi:hypothetical protein